MVNRDAAWWTTVNRNLILLPRRWRKLVPKFHHGELYGIQYSARAVGFWRRFTPLTFFPYLTGDAIIIHLKLKRKEDWWPQAVLKRNPSVDIDYPIEFVGERIALTDWPFRIDDVQPGQTWSMILPVQGGMSFGEPCDIQCSVELQKINSDTDGIINRCIFRIADIEVVSRGPFIVKVIGWGVGITFALALLIVGILNLAYA